jgi:hypothetical protein
MTAEQFAELSGALPSHQDEVMAAHQGQPSAEVQNATHGAAAPAPDYGVSDAGKYYPGGM